MNAKAPFSLTSVSEQVLAGTILLVLSGLGAVLWGVFTGEPIRMTMWRLAATLVEPVTAPFWVVLVAVVALGVVAVRLLGGGRRSAVGPAQSSKRQEIGADELLVMGLFLAYDAEELPLELVRAKLDLTMLRFEDALHSLYQRDFAYADRADDPGRQKINLLPAGRRWLLSRQQPLLAV